MDGSGGVVFSGSHVFGCGACMSGGVVWKWLPVLMWSRGVRRDGWVCRSTGGGVTESLVRRIQCIPGLGAAIYV